MPPRSALIFLVLLLALLLCACSVRLLPFGRGTFTAVNGRTSPLKAWREAVRILSVMRLVLISGLLANQLVAFFAHLSAAGF